MTDDRIDFSPLDPSADKQHFEEIVQSITARAAPALAARRVRSSFIAEVVYWRRPMLAAAAVILIVSATALVRIESPTRPPELEPGVAEAIGVPATLARWVTTDEVPTPAQLVAGLEEIR